MVRIDNFRKSLIRAMARHNLELRSLGVPSVTAYFEYVENMEQNDASAFRQLAPLVVSNKDNFSCTSRFWLKALECEGFADTLLLTVSKIAQGGDRHIQFNEKNEDYVRELLIEIKYLITSNVSESYFPLAKSYGLENDSYDQDEECGFIAFPMNSVENHDFVQNDQEDGLFDMNFNQMVEFLGPCPKVEKKKQWKKDCSASSVYSDDISTTVDFPFEEKDCFMSEQIMNNIDYHVTPALPKVVEETNRVDGMSFLMNGYQSSAMVNQSSASGKKADPLEFILEEMDQTA